MDVERALVAAVETLVPALAGRVVNYDAVPPRISSDDELYAIVRLTSLETGFMLPSGRSSGRWQAQWDLTLIGGRSAVVANETDIPIALTAYHSTPDLTITGSYLTNTETARREDVPAGSAGAVLQFTSEVF